MDNRPTQDIIDEMEEDSFPVWVIKGAVKVLVGFILGAGFIFITAAICYMCSSH